jgi:hypothetical protein
VVIVAGYTGYICVIELNIMIHCIMTCFCVYIFTLFCVYIEIAFFILIVFLLQFLYVAFPLYLYRCIIEANSIHNTGLW